ncbi:hypothetical protein [Luteolibacter luteus]|uniref:Uncharacterized protein n=1 Tax=Luteolibacter luteus TaxID=2728835 RepID=A0A858RCU6_9BACT|nr:hypothetical protein [Luteolibacter luteus]QJE94617.1 hypothetical protein HHL09_02070 [Luteolibacter luteus]
MNVATSTIIQSTAERLWPLLTSSQMTASGRFCLGVPRPVACELPSAVGEVGAERRCISDRGTVIQTITHWNPPTRLKFRMRSTDHQWGRCVESIEEDFHIEEIPKGVRITRVTRIKAKGFLSRVKEALFCIGLKRVHFYVFKNWRNQPATASF